MRKSKLEPGERKKRGIDIACQFCQIFHDISIGDRTINKNNLELSCRYCPAVKQDVNFRDQSCQYFEPSKFFWCSQQSFFSSAEVCIDRIGKGRDMECSKCNEGRQIWMYYNPVQIIYTFID